MHIEVECKGCRTRYRVDASLAGRTAACKHCGRRFIVPYRTSVIELGDESIVAEPTPLAPAEPVAVAPAAHVERDDADRDDDAAGDGVDFNDPSLLPLADEPSEQRAPLARPRGEPVIPQVLTDVWIPLIVVAIAAGCAGYAAVTRAIDAPNAVVALGLLGLGLVLYVLLAMPLTIRGLQAAGDSLGFTLPNAYWLQTLAAFAVPTAAMALGYFNGGPRGAVIGGAVGLLTVWPLMILMYRLRVLRAMSAVLAGAICYIFALGVVAAAVAGASVVISLAGLTLPWETPAAPAAVVEAPAVVPTEPEPVAEPEPAPAVVADVPVADRATLAAISPDALVYPKGEPKWLAAVDAPTPEGAWRMGDPHLLEVRGPVVRVQSVPAGPCVALVDRDSCDVYDLRSGRRAGFIKQALQPAGTMKLISPDGAHLVIDRSAATRALEVWSTRDQRVECTIRGGHASPQPVGFVGNDELAVMTFDNAGKPLVQVWGVKAGQMLRQFDVPPTHSAATALSPTGRFFAMSHNNRLHVYDLQKRVLAGDREIPAAAQAAQAPRVLALSFSRDGGELAVFVAEPMPESTRLLVWSMADGKLVNQATMNGAAAALPAPGMRAHAAGERPEVQWLPDGGGFMIGGELFDRTSGKKFYTIPPQSAGQLTGRPVRMVTNFHVLHEFMPPPPPPFQREAVKGDKLEKVIYRCYALPKGDVEAALRAVRPVEAAPAPAPASQAAEPAHASSKSPPSTAPATAPAAPAAAGVAHALARAKLEAGLAELSAGHDREAQRLCADAIAALPKAPVQRLDDDTQINLYHALAVAHLRLGEIPKAKQAMDRVRSATKTNRSIALNDAYLDVRTKQNIPRALATLDKYFAAGAVEEDALNLYRLAVSAIDADATTRTRAAALWDKYRQYEAKLAPPTPGVRRWGSRWLTAAEMAPVEAQRRQAEQAKRDLQQRIASLESQLGSAKTRAAAANAEYQAVRSRDVTDYRLPRLARAANETAADVNRLHKEVNRAREQFHKLPAGPKPTFEAVTPFTPSLDLQLK